jgi:Tfp pilus assembly protein PilZ
MFPEDTTRRMFVVASSSSSDDGPEERTARGFFVAPAPAVERDEEDRTAVEGRALRYQGRDEPATVLTTDMVEELRRRLREAEEREASGVRIRPTPEKGLSRPELALDAALDSLAGLEPDPALDLDIEVEEPRTLDELEEVLSPLPELEVALAPESDSNFYAAFDDEHPSGVFLATYTSVLPIGAPVYLTVHLPGGSFRTPALVEWVRPAEAAAPGSPPGVGFALCGLDVRQQRLIRAFVRHRRPMFYVV